MGRGLVRALRAAGVEVVGLHARHESEEATSFGEYPTTITDANIVIVAVRDGGIDDVYRSLIALHGKKRRGLASGTVVLHTSGTAQPPSIAQLRALGLSGGTFHPLIAFASAGRAAALLRDAWIGIDGDANACAASRRIAAALGARTVGIPSGGKAAYHAAAVMASNFPVVLAWLSGRVLMRSGIPEQTAEQVVQSLMASAVENLAHGPPASVLTGPAARGDDQTISAHLDALRDDAETRAVYDLLTRVARTMSAPGTSKSPGPVPASKKGTS